MNNGTPLGATAAELMSNGQLLPTPLTLQLLLKAMLGSGSNKFLLDGFPGTLEQLEAFESQVGGGKER